GLVAASQALEHAGLARAGEPLGGFDPERTGVVIGTGIGGLGSIEEQSLNILEKGPRRVSPTLVPAAVPDGSGNEIARKDGLEGLCCSESAACSPGNDALIYATRCIREGPADFMVAGGSEATVTPSSIATFGNLRALSRGDGDPTRVCRP